MPNNVNNIYSVTYDYLSSTSGIQKLFFSPASKTIQWIELVAPSLITAPLLQIKKNLGRVDKIFSIFHLPEKISSLQKKISEIHSSKTLSKFFENIIHIFKKFISLLNKAGNNLRFANYENFILLSPFQLTVLNRLSIFKSMSSVVVKIIKIKNYINVIIENTKPNLNYYLFKTIKKIVSLVSTLIGLGVIFLGGNVTTQFILLSLSTISIGFSNFDYYYENYLLTKI